MSWKGYLGLLVALVLVAVSVAVMIWGSQSVAHFLAELWVLVYIGLIVLLSVGLIRVTKHRDPD